MEEIKNQTIDTPAPEEEKTEAPEEVEKSEDENLE